MLSVARNFGEADYEALLELDNEPPVGRSQLSEAELGRLRTHIHHLKAEALPKRPPRPMPGSASSCTDKVGQQRKELRFSVQCLACASHATSLRRLESASLALWQPVPVVGTGRAGLLW